MENYKRFGSEYDGCVSSTVKPGDYRVPLKDANSLVEYDLMNNPKLFASTRRSAYDPARTETMLQKAGEQSLGNTTKHWKTNSQHTNETQLASHLTVSERPLWSYPRQAYSSKRSYFQTEF